MGGFMRLSAQIVYAYKAVLELSLRYKGDNPIQISIISQAQKIPRKYLIQILLRLKNAGLVKSTRGAAGGYYLARSLSQISLADVCEAIDETIADTSSSSERKATDSEKLLRRIWGDINSGILDRLKKTTFDKLIAQLQGQQITYQI
jgi:Rrf2 family protein